MNLLDQEAQEVEDLIDQVTTDAVRYPREPRAIALGLAAVAEAMIYCTKLLIAAITVLDQPAKSETEVRQMDEIDFDDAVQLIQVLDEWMEHNGWTVKPPLGEDLAELSIMDLLKIRAALYQRIYPQGGEPG